MFIEKIRSFGFTGQCLKLLKIYLTDRKQTVRIRKAVSETIPVHNGVPQGSNLGPFCLFSIQMNYQIVQYQQVFGYADDYNMVCNDTFI